MYLELISQRKNPQPSKKVLLIFFSSSISLHYHLFVIHWYSLIIINIENGIVSKSEPKISSVGITGCSVLDFKRWIISPISKKRRTIGIIEIIKEIMKRVVFRLILFLLFFLNTSKPQLALRNGMADSFPNIYYYY